MVALPGEIDMANAGRVCGDLDAAVAPGVGAVIADMPGARFCDASGICALALARQRAKAGRWRCSGPGPGETATATCERTTAAADILLPSTF